ncbi:MAG: DUF2961 domain-containing protein [Victivallales bacterium]|nr:DUF2961 domain-containing protein [Victivallales bacterium]
MNNMLDSFLRPPTGYSFCADAENVYGLPGGGGRAVPGEPQEEVARIGQNQNTALPASEELGRGWKVRPYTYLEPKQEITLFDVDGPACIHHFWLTVDGRWLRELILKVYWDNEETPSILAPLGDFFCNAAGYTATLQSLAFCVNPTNALNCYLPMPFRKHARITIENLAPQRSPSLYYCINFTREPIPEDALYLHASFRRQNPLPLGTDFTILDGVKGAGRFAGCYLTWQSNNNGWWGEGEIKMYIDDDREFPTICGTGTEDYFCGAWNFQKEFCSPYSGCPLGAHNETAGARHSLYRFHINDPVFFHTALKVDIQAIGWRSGGRYLPLQDDISATAYWYQTLPHAPLPSLPDRNGLEVI